LQFEPLFSLLYRRGGAKGVAVGAPLAKAVHAETQRTQRKTRILLSLRPLRLGVKKRCFDVTLTSPDVRGQKGTHIFPLA